MAYDDDNDNDGYVGDDDYGDVVKCKVVMVMVINLYIACYIFEMLLYIIMITIITIISSVSYHIYI